MRNDNSFSSSQSIKTKRIYLNTAIKCIIQLSFNKILYIKKYYFITCKINIYKKYVYYQLLFNNILIHKVVK